MTTGRGASLRTWTSRGREMETIACRRCKVRMSDSDKLGSAPCCFSVRRGPAILPVWPEHIEKSQQRSPRSLPASSRERVFFSSASWSLDKTLAWVVVLGWNRTVPPCEKSAVWTEVPKYCLLAVGGKDLAGCGGAPISWKTSWIPRWETSASAMTSMASWSSKYAAPRANAQPRAVPMPREGKRLKATTADSSPYANPCSTVKRQPREPTYTATTEYGRCSSRTGSPR